jgi:hypothetical protein
MEHFDRFIIGGAAVVIGILGLFLASRAVDGVFYAVGLLLFAFSIFFVFRLIAQDEPADQ